MLFLAGNYAKHVAERGGTAAEREETFPYVFMKPPSTTLTHPGDPIIIPRVSPDQIDWECELGVVIGRRCRHVDEDEALGYVAGYTVVNDISDRGFKPNPGASRASATSSSTGCTASGTTRSARWARASSRPTWCPTRRRLPIKLSVNGQIKQDATTAEMVFPVAGDRLVPLRVGHAPAGRRDRHRHAVGRRLGDRHLPQARRPGPCHDRADRHAGESRRGGDRSDFLTRRSVDRSNAIGDRLINAWYRL